MTETTQQAKSQNILVAVLAIQTALAVTAGATLIFDPWGLLDNPRTRLIAGVLITAAVIVAILLAVRFLRGQRAEQTRTRTSDQLMDTVMTTSHEWVWAVDDQGRFTFSSPASIVAVGWAPDELLGRHYNLVIEGTDLVSAQQGVAATPGPGWSGVIVRCRHRDGTAVWMEVAGTGRPASGNRPGSFEGSSRLLPPLTAREETNSHRRTRLQEMIDQKLILTAFQPIYHLTTGHLIGVESLSRFVDEDGAGADYWFTQASVVGLAAELELATLHTALETAAGLPPGIYVALNISPQTCLDPRLPAILLKSVVPLKRLVLELTERVEVAEYGPLIEALAPLRDRGLRIAVDDAGSGFASMRHVLHIRPDIIKLDRSLIAGIDDNDGQRALGAAMVEFGRHINATLVAEGIETPAELAAVAAIGMTAAQGYLLGRPSIHPTDWAGWFRIRGPGAYRLGPISP